MNDDIRMAISEAIDASIAGIHAARLVAITATHRRQKRYGLDVCVQCGDGYPCYTRRIAGGDHDHELATIVSGDTPHHPTPRNGFSARNGFPNPPVGDIA